MASLLLTGRAARLTRFALFTLLAAGVAACGDSALPTASDRPGIDIPDPSFAQSDGSTGGSGYVWFLPPLVPNPAGNPDYEPENFDPTLDVRVEIFECIGTDVPDMPCLELAATPAAEGDAEIPNNNDHYQFNWKTPKNSADEIYRALVKVGLNIVGFIDIELVQGNASAAPGNAAVRTGANAAIKVMIEEGLPNCDVDNDVCVALVPSGSPSEILIPLETTDGGETPDFTVLIPAGTTFEDENGDPVDNVVFTLERNACDAFPVDLLLLGECFTANTDPPNLTLSNLATVSVCGLDEQTGLGDQEDLVTIHQFDVDPGPDQITFAEALAHAEERCDGPEEISSSATALGRLAQAVKGRVADWLSPESLNANALLHTGGGGQTAGFRSSFAAALPSATEAGDDFATDEGGQPETVDALIGGALVPDPVVKVVDASVGGEEFTEGLVAGAFVRFSVEEGNGTLACFDDDASTGICEETSAGTEYRVETDSNGEARVEWTLPDEDDVYEMTAIAKGMVGPGETVLGGPDDETGTRVDCNASIPGSLPAGCGTRGPFEGVVFGEIIFTANAAFEAIAVQDPGEGPGPVNVFGLNPLGDGTTVVGDFISYGDPQGASSNTGLEIKDVSQLFLYSGSDGEGGSELSLVIIHDRFGTLGIDTGGEAEFDFDWGTASGPAGVVWQVKDDPNAGDDYDVGDDGDELVGTVHWEWNPCCTDGGTLGPLPTDFALTITPEFIFGKFNGDPSPPPDVSAGAGVIDEWRIRNPLGSLQTIEANPTPGATWTPAPITIIRGSGGS